MATMSSTEILARVLIIGHLAFLFLAAVAEGQENPADATSSYNIGPYRHIYPPTNISIDQKTCIPDPASVRTCPLFIDLLMSFGGAFTSSGVVPGIQVALDQINSQQDLLPGYTLHYTLQDSQCDRTTSLDALHSGIFEPPTKIAVIGSGCSVATEPTAEISHYYNLTQLSCVSSSSGLSNRRRFPNHFQLSTAEISLAYGYFGVIQVSEWRKVTIITQDESLFTTTMNELKRLLNATNISFSEIRFETDTGIDVDPFAVDPDSRIYILSMYSGYAREILCRAYITNQNFRYPRNLFLLNGWYADRWWVGTEEQQAMLKEKYDCDAKQRESLLPSTLAPSTSGRIVLNYSTVADNGYTGEEIQSLYKSYVQSSLLNVRELFLYQLCYDTVWTLARALNNTLSDLKNDADLRENLRPFQSEAGNADFGLQHFTYDNNVLLNNIFGHLSTTDFFGIVGRILFDENGGRRLNNVQLNQYRFGEDGRLRAIPVGHVNRISEFKFDITYQDGIDTLWSNGVPYDGIPTEKIVSVHLAVTIIFSLLASCGIIFAAVCMILHIYFRNKTIIRLTSPNLNVIIAIGAIVLYINMVFYVTPSYSRTAETWLCNLNPWLTAIGYSLCYGTILSKMVRVYYIFHNPFLQKKLSLKDWVLALLVLFLVIIDVVILLVYTVTEGAKGHFSSTTRVPNKENIKDSIGIFEETISYFIFVCNSKHRYITLGILYGYKVILQVVALILAVSIRKVKIKGLNDAAFIIAAIYVTSIVTSVIVVSTYTLSELVNMNAVVFSLCLFIGTTVILILVFIPPIVGLYRDPMGETVFKSKKGTTIGDGHISALELESTRMDQSDNVMLRKRIQVLEREVTTLALEHVHRNLTLPDLSILKFLEFVMSTSIPWSGKGMVREKFLTMLAAKIRRCLGDRADDGTVGSASGAAAMAYSHSIAVPQQQDTPVEPPDLPGVLPISAVVRKITIATIMLRRRWMMAARIESLQAEAAVTSEDA